ncbi:phosphatase PAP2 family protein [Streptomyces sp. NPDC059398]|uniref:phosphatase PAP2 family protein n=1 Tax=Streptomyces sp. NPDC059398 TaxID=3346820 RepID=UPI00367BC121
MNRRGAADLAVSGAVGSLAGFVLLTLVVVGHHGAPLLTDGWLLSWSVHHRPPVAVAAARGVTDTGSGLVPYLLTVLAGVIAGRGPRQRVTAAVACLACLVVAQLVRYGVMSLVARERPPAGDWAAQASGWSFPSGHTTTSAVTAGLLIAAVLLRVRHGRRTIAAGIGCWAVLVGLSRVYLGVHWSTDVAGGWLLALCWLCLCFRLAVRHCPAVPHEANDPHTPHVPHEPRKPHEPHEPHDSAVPLGKQPPESRPREPRPRDGADGHAGAPGGSYGETH